MDESCEAHHLASDLPQPPPTHEEVEEADRSFQASSPHEVSDAGSHHIVNPRSSHNFLCTCTTAAKAAPIHPTACGKREGSQWHAWLGERLCHSGELVCRKCLGMYGMCNAASWGPSCAVRNATEGAEKVPDKTNAAERNCCITPRAANGKGDLLVR